MHGAQTNELVELVLGHDVFGYIGFCVPVQNFLIVIGNGRARHPLSFINIDLSFLFTSLFGLGPPRVSAVVTAIEIFHMDGMVFINNDAGFVFWARATRVRALNIACSRQGRIETNVLVEVLHV